MGRNFDAIVGIDLSQQQDVLELFSYLDKFKPLVVVAGPPCTPFGPWSHLNSIVARDTWLSSMRVALPLANLTAAVCQYQQRHGRFFIIENPRTSQLWKLPAFKQ